MHIIAMFKKFKCILNQSISGWKRGPIKCMKICVLLIVCTQIPHNFPDEILQSHLVTIVIIQTAQNWVQETITITRCGVYVHIVFVEEFNNFCPKLIQNCTMPPEKNVNSIPYCILPQKYQKPQARWTVQKMTCLFTVQDQNRCKQIWYVAASWAKVLKLLHFIM